MIFKPTTNQITLHGLGFLQVILNDTMRLNVWHPELPRRSCFNQSSIHDHRFGFTSKVLIGEQVNQYYREVKKPYSDREHTHFAYLHEGERSKFGNRPWLVDYKCTLEKVGDEEHISTGDEYNVSPYIAHSTNCEGVCVTLMTKVSEHNQGSHSYCVRHITPDVDFDRKQWSESKLWSVFNDAMKQANHLKG